jgi:hypothetical protein
MSTGQWITRTRRAAILALTAFTVYGCPDDEDDTDYDIDTEVSNAAPYAYITKPVSNTTIGEGDELTLEGYGDDDEDGVLQGDGLAWSSDVDGNLGTGSPLTVTTLSAGHHTIKLTATDSEGATYSDTRDVAVFPAEYGGENQEPVVTVTSPEGYTHHAVGEIVVLEGTAIDPEEGELTGNNLVWWAYGPGGTQEIGLGNRVELDDLPVGSWQFSLSARDPYGKYGNSGQTPPISVGLWESNAACQAVKVTPATIRVTSGMSGSAFVTLDLADPPIFEFDLEDGASAVSEVFSSVSAEENVFSSRDRELSYTAHAGLADGQSFRVTLRAHLYYREQPITCAMPLAVEVGSPGQNTAPQATILWPQDGSGAAAGDNILFEGSGSDVEDGQLTGASLVWESNIDGQIGTGETFRRNDLSGGTHTITLRVTDSQGATASASIQLLISAPAANAAIYGTVTFDGEPVPGVTVTMSGAASATAVTSNQGYYYFPNLTGGTYTVTISGLPQGMVITPTVQTVTIGSGDTVEVSFSNS